MYSTNKKMSSVFAFLMVFFGVGTSDAKYNEKVYPRESFAFIKKN